MKFISLFLLLWVIFALLDPDPDSGIPLNPDPIRIRIHKTLQERNPWKYTTVFGKQKDPMAEILRWKRISKEKAANWQLSQPSQTVWIPALCKMRVIILEGLGHKIELFRVKSCSKNHQYVQKVEYFLMKKEIWAKKLIHYGTEMLVMRADITKVKLLLLIEMKGKTYRKMLSLKLTTYIKIGRMCSTVGIF